MTSNNTDKFLVQFKEVTRLSKELLNKLQNEVENDKLRLIFLKIKAKRALENSKTKNIKFNFTQKTTEIYTIYAQLCNLFYRETRDDILLSGDYYFEKILLPNHPEIQKLILNETFEPGSTVYSQEALSLNQLMIYLEKKFDRAIAENDGRVFLKTVRNFVKKMIPIHETEYFKNPEYLKLINIFYPYRKYLSKIMIPSPQRFVNSQESWLATPYHKPLLSIIQEVEKEISQDRLKDLAFFYDFLRNFYFTITQKYLNNTFDRVQSDFLKNLSYSLIAPYNPSNNSRYNIISTFNEFQILNSNLPSEESRSYFLLHKLQKFYDVLQKESQLLEGQLTKNLPTDCPSIYSYLPLFEKFFLRFLLLRIENIFATYTIIPNNKQLDAFGFDDRTFLDDWVSYYNNQNELKPTVRPFSFDQLNEKISLTSDLLHIFIKTNVNKIINFIFTPTNSTNKIGKKIQDKRNVNKYFTLLKMIKTLNNSSLTEVYVFEIIAAIQIVEKRRIYKVKWNDFKNDLDIKPKSLHSLLTSLSDRINITPFKIDSEELPECYLLHDLFENQISLNFGGSSNFELLESRVTIRKILYEWITK